MSKLKMIRIEEMTHEERRFKIAQILTPYIIKQIREKGKHEEERKTA